jgi:hypothetical protein
MQHMPVTRTAGEQQCASMHVDVLYNLLRSSKVRTSNRFALLYKESIAAPELHHSPCRSRES